MSTENSDIKRYYALDEYRFIGNPKRTKARADRDIVEMTEYLKAKKAGLPFDFKAYRKAEKNKKTSL